MTAARPVAEREAIDWEVQLRHDTHDADALRAFAAWHAVPAHAAAWAALQHRLGRMGGRASLDAAAIAQALRSPVADRRRALRAGFALGAVVLTGWGGLRAAHSFGLDADWRSDIGERGAGTLADGTPLRFDAASRIDLGGSTAAPHLRLRQGQLLVRARRPLSIGAGGATVATDNATLAAGRLGRRTVVAVTGGAATVHPADGIPRRLDAGQAACVDADGVQPSLLSFAAATAWTRGMLVADRLPLPDLLDAFGRYHPGLLRAHGAAAGRSVSGIFRLADLDGALRQLAAALPVRIERYGGLVTVVS